MKKYTRTTNATFNLGYHITFCPKYRQSFLCNLDRHLLVRVFQIAAIKVQGLIENIEIMPDHIHIFIRMKRNHVPIPRIIQSIKGFSSFRIREINPWMKKYKALWGAGYFVESVGNMSEGVIKKYIDNQRTNVKPSYRYKDEVKQALKTSPTHNSRFLEHIINDGHKMSRYPEKDSHIRQTPSQYRRFNDVGQQKRVQLSTILSEEVVRDSWTVVRTLSESNPRPHIEPYR